MPTVLSLLGLPAAERPPTDGVDLSPRLLLGSEPSSSTELVSVAESGSSLQERCFGSLSSGHLSDRHCVNEGRWSYCGRPGQAYDLYDHVNDPELAEPITSSHPEVVQEMRDILGRWPPQQPRWRSARTPRFKLVEWPLAEGGYASALYDLQADPGETQNVAEQYDDIMASLREALQQGITGRPQVEDSTLTEEEMDDLRELGYIE